MEGRRQSESETELTAVVFAAGVGSRLGAAACAPHKSLVRLGGRTLLHWHARRLAARGIEHAFVVTGHAAREVEAEAQAAALTANIRMTTIHNPRFTSGSILSLQAAAAAIERTAGPLLLVDADVFYAADVLVRLLDSTHPSVLLVDREFPQDDDDPMLVPIRGGRPFDFCKRWRGTADWVGESVGLFRVAAADRGALIEIVHRRIAEGRTEDFYDDAIRELVTAGRFGCEDITGLPWIEIDFPDDVRRAQSEVLPLVCAREGLQL